MTKYIVVCNRRGGVGKTTVTMMLAYGRAVIGRQRVLVVDLDGQASSSLVIMGNTRFKEARRQRRTVAHLLESMHGNDPISAADFVETNVGDVLLPDGNRPHLDMIASSHELDDRETEMVIARSGAYASIEELFFHIEARIGEIIRSLDGAYDDIIIDCAPGLSHVVWGALRIADYVVVPYLPDQTAEDNVGWLCARLDRLGLEQRYRTVPNRVSGHDQRAPGIIAAIDGRFEALGVKIASSQPLATALDFRTTADSLSSKFGASTKHVKEVSEAMLNWMSKSREEMVA